jgi:GNAT superfamily N-acetyltransferase
VADEAELFRIYAGIFGEAAAEANRSRWAWQYRDNPQSPEGPVLWVARHGGQPLGQMGTMPVALWWGSGEVRASWGIDYFVRRDAEGRGYGAALVHAWMAGVDVALAVGLTPTAYLIYRRLGFRDLGHLHFFQAILDPAAVARRRLGRVAGTVAGPFLGAAQHVLRMRSGRLPPDIEVRHAAEIGPEYDALWDRVRPGFAACVRRDAAYVRWKYRQCPHRTYALLEARRAGVLTGFAVTRHEDYRGLRLGWIVDLFASPDDRPTRDALLAAAVSSLKAARVARAQALCSSACLAADLRRHGFFAGVSRTRLCARATGVCGAPLDRPGDWHIVFGDADMDR